MSTHTSGPWERQWSWNGFDIVADGPPIARVHFGDDMESAIANSHLIAAAPDLLAALKALTQDSRFNLVIGGNPNAVDALVKQVDEALAKAEGKGQAA